MNSIKNNDVSGLRKVARFYSEKDDIYFIVYNGDITVTNGYVEDDEAHYDEDEYDIDPITFVFSAKLVNGSWENVVVAFESFDDKAAKNRLKRQHSDLKNV